MKQIEVILNGKKIVTEAGITILELARREGIEIPTLCHDEELKPYGSCWVCAVEVKGRRGFVTSCGTYLGAGMEITTDNEEIIKARKMALELLISNHYADCEAPCKIACPDHVDVQAYVSLIANGQYHEAVKVIKDTLPMPLSIGRVCPAFCEKECRRQIVEEPIAIRQLKRFCADEDLNDAWNYIPERLPDKGKKVAIIGGGPSGLTCGYYLSNNGFAVTVFEASPQAGGWLRYGIPEYRLPKDILDREIELMCANGMQIRYNTPVGEGITLKQLSRDYDAVYIAIGAQKAVPMPVKGSDLTGCYLGVDFLKAYARGNTPPIGKRVAIVGGGNTAIDCARTSLRLGSQVTIIYRRTKEEMPAEPFEIAASEHEGIRFLYLTNPVEYKGENGVLREVVLEKMKLGEPDSSGRRRPEPTHEYFVEPFDAIIAAISQVPEVDIFAREENYAGDTILPISRWQTAIVDQNTMHTGLGNVFAGGDFQRGAATAIEAIADGKIAAQAIDRYLLGMPLTADKPRFDAKKGKKVKDITAEEYQDFARIERVPMPEITVTQAQSSFEEVETGYPEPDAVREAGRCLECGCQVNETCALRQYCTDHDIVPDRFSGSIAKHPIDHSHPFIQRDANKCINCGRCIRTCAEIQGAAVLGYIYRGFPTVVAPEFGMSLTDTGCESCGKCIAVCPVGALVERNLYYKMNPLTKDECIQNCGICGTGCVIKTETQTTRITRITTPEKDERDAFNGRNLCFKGRFGWQVLLQHDRLTEPMRKTPNGWQAISWQEATKLISERSSGVAKRFEISPFVTLEELLMLQSAAQSQNASFGICGYKPRFDDALLDRSPKTVAYQQLDAYDEYVVVGEINHTLRTILRLRQNDGRKLILINPPEAGFNRFADTILSSLDHLEPNDRQLFIYNLNRSSEEDAWQVWQKAAAIDPSGKNVLCTSDFPNLTGLLVVASTTDCEQDVRFIYSIGAYPGQRSLQENDPTIAGNSPAFKVAAVYYLDPNAPVDLLLPAPSYLETTGIALANDGIITRYHNPARSDMINHLMKLYYELGWIHPNTAEVNFWTLQCQELLHQLTEHKPLKWNEMSIDPALLDRDIHPADSQITRKIDELYKLRRIRSWF